jgi:hypothetical protein
MRRTLLLSLISAAALAAASPAGAQTEALARIVPVAGSTAGNFGSYFRTGLQLYNAGGAPMSGHFVYHPAGSPGSAGDPRLAFQMAAGETLSYADVVASIGQTGLGSLDLLIVPSASASPVVVTRVFNDAGANGTSGFTEEAVDPSATGPGAAVLTAGTAGVLIAPADPARFRFNLGVRTLSAGASLSVEVRSAAGSVTRVVAKVLPASYFVQQSSDAFLGAPVGPGGSLTIRVTAGSAIVYGATVDNTTNDPSFQVARVVSGG